MFVKSLIKTTFLVVLFFIPKISLANVVINEVLYDAEGVDTGKEYIILYNNGDSSIDLTNYELNAVSGDYYIFPSFLLEPKSFVVIHWRAEGTDTKSDLYTGTNGFDANMGDSSGWVALFRSHPTTSTAKDLIVDYLEYGAAGKTWESAANSAGIWPAGSFIPDVQAGKSIKLKIDGQDNNSPDDWMESVPTITSAPQQASDQNEKNEVKNQFVNNPPVADAGDDIIAFVGQKIKFGGTKSIDPDNDELHYEWNMGDGKLIEKPSFEYQYLYPGTYLVALMVYDGKAYSTDTVTVKIQSIKISINEFLPNPIGKDAEEWIEIYNDSDGITDISGWQIDDEEDGSKPFVFPQNTILAPKSYTVFSHQITGVSLNNDKDSVRLIMPEGIVFQEIKYEKPPEGKSSAKTNEGFIWSPPTPGMINFVISKEKEDKKTIYQEKTNTEITKNPSQNQAVVYYSPQQKIETGYEIINSSDNDADNENKGRAEKQLANAEKTMSIEGSNNLIYTLLLIVLSGLIIGILLTAVIKRKKRAS